MNLLNILTTYECLKNRYATTDRDRARMENIAANCPNLRRDAERIIQHDTEVLCDLWQDIERIEAELPEALHEAAQIVNRLA